MRNTKTKTELSLSFKEFFYIWASTCEPAWKVKAPQDVPKIHWQIIDWLDSSDDWENNTGVLQVFRGAAKSTIVGLYITYMLVKDPTLRFLILSADKNTAQKITQALTGIVSRHPLAKHLRGKEGSWRTDQLWVSGSTDDRTPSAYSRGILSNVTGSRADFVVFDDVEVPKNAGTADLRDRLRHKMSDTAHILVPGGKRLFVGTPHSFESIYPEVIADGAASLKIPLLNEYEGEWPHIQGESIWPERFNSREVAKRQVESKTKANFLSQYQLIPYNADDYYFDPTNLVQYECELKYFTANREDVLEIDGKRMVGCSCFWDPSLSKQGRDDSVIVVVYQTEDGHFYLHDIQSLKGDVYQQCELAKQFAEKHKLPNIAVETNGIGATLPAILRKALKDTHIAVIESYATKNKVIKIQEALSAPLSGRLIHIHNRVYESKFMSQLRDFTPSIVGGNTYKDDFIDAVASAIHNQPTRINSVKSNYTSANRWQPNQGNFELAAEGFSF